MTGILLAVPDCAQEPELVTQAPGQGLRVLRRCVDAVDLLAAAVTDPSAAVVLSANLPRLSREAVDRLSAARGRHVVGLATDDSAETRLLGMGVEKVVRVGPTAVVTMRRLVEALSGEPRPAAGPEPGVWATQAWTPASPSPTEPSGTVIAVWGPMGAPGRTTVAVGISEALADRGRRVCLVDADTYAPSVAMALGVLEESSGLVVACRHADNGSLTGSTLEGLARRLRGDWLLLGGLARAEDWPDLRAGALERVWETCREVFDVTVIDVGFCVEEADGASAWNRQRNAATLTALAAADHVVAVADDSAGGAARMAAAWPSMNGRRQTGETTIVRNRSRTRGGAWLEAIRACGIAAPVVPVPRDDQALASCWDQGRSLGEGARRSRIRRSLVELADLIVSG